MPTKRRVEVNWRMWSYEIPEIVRVFYDETDAEGFDGKMEIRRDGKGMVVFNAYN